MRILVVEDDPVLMDGLKVGLGLSGATVDEFPLRRCARGPRRTGRWAAVVLDLMLPDGSGLDVLAELRARDDATPVLLLTALDDTADRVRSLGDAGADDYLGKPFDLDELAARVRAIARRGRGRARPVLKAGALVLDPATFSATVWRGGRWRFPQARVRGAERAHGAAGRHPLKGEIEERLYGWQEEVESNAVGVHVHNLRAKVGRGVIETVRGLGYRVREPQWASPLRTGSCSSSCSRPPRPSGCAAGWIYLSSRAELERVLDARLQEAARMVHSLVADGNISPAAQAPAFAEGGYERQLSCRIWSLGASWWPAPRARRRRPSRAPERAFPRRDVNGEAWRVCTILDEGKGVRVMVGDRVGLRNHWRGIWWPGWWVRWCSSCRCWACSSGSASGASCGP